MSNRARAGSARYSSATRESTYATEVTLASGETIFRPQPAPTDNEPAVRRLAHRLLSTRAVREVKVLAWRRGQYRPISDQRG